MSYETLFTMKNIHSLTDSTRQHILRAYLQCFLWINAPFLDDILLNPLDFGYMLDENGELVPILTLPDMGFFDLTKHGGGATRPAVN